MVDNGNDWCAGCVDKCVDKVNCPNRIINSILSFIPIDSMAGVSFKELEQMILSGESTETEQHSKDQEIKSCQVIV